MHMQRPDSEEEFKDLGFDQASLWEDSLSSGSSSSRSSGGGGKGRNRATRFMINLAQQEFGSDNPSITQTTITDDADNAKPAPAPKSIEIPYSFVGSWYLGPAIQAMLPNFVGAVVAMNYHGHDNAHQAFYHLVQDAVAICQELISRHVECATGHPRGDGMDPDYDYVETSLSSSLALVTRMTPRDVLLNLLVTGVLNSWISLNGLAMPARTYFNDICLVLFPESWAPADEDDLFEKALESEIQRHPVLGHCKFATLTAVRDEHGLGRLPWPSYALLEYKKTRRASEEWYLPMTQVDFRTIEITLTMVIGQIISENNSRAFDTGFISRHRDASVQFFENVILKSLGDPELLKRLRNSGASAPGKTEIDVTIGSVWRRIQLALEDYSPDKISAVVAVQSSLLFKALVDGDDQVRKD